MREIKFRAWDKKGKKIREIDSMSFHNHKSCFDTSNSHLPKVVNLWGINCIEQKDIILHREGTEFILMQFTGLKDKNGKEIYEGDIITYLGYSAYGRDSEKSQIIIEWSKEEAGFDLGWLFRPDDGDIGLCNLEIEIIGNIYENPELLKEVKKE